jgi:hypothetical protein
VEHGKLYELYAILIGVKSRFLPAKEKMLTGFRFKQYLEKALKINPNNGYLYYLMGRFKYEISELNWFQKKVRCYLEYNIIQFLFEYIIVKFKFFKFLFT